MSELAKLEGLAIGLEQRGEKSAAQQVRWAVAEIERLRAEVGELTKGPEWEQIYQETTTELRAEIERLRAEFKRFMDVCCEGTNRGRPMDFISAGDWKRACRAREGK